ncbi:DNA-directed RNA polymerase subunit omega [Tepidibacter thalassicus]|uniref:DNA-directed RNA polymerase subunit omega n=1 Tax=Tepidibacter thalassicus DSM 15285 TaxID=1123350 RepID=A0A1M5Q7B6_9FIRM|nr:DNA-directed RNA polymerase subunit omega [Tepidibacter thalassicus]SHH09810.1 DNA-directed RNA polymerase subunit omega [Tepidibacter thalassicus DSM 15285]
MLNPSINELLKKIDNRYSLVIAVSKRARKLIDGDEGLVDVKENKPVAIATYEVAQDKITCRPMTNEEVEKMQEDKKNKDNIKE